MQPDLCSRCRALRHPVRPAYLTPLQPLRMRSLSFHHTSCSDPRAFACDLPPRQECSFVRPSLGWLSDPESLNKAAGHIHLWYFLFREHFPLSEIGFFVCLLVPLLLPQSLQPPRTQASCVFCPPSSEMRTMSAKGKPFTAKEYLVGEGKAQSSLSGAWAPISGTYGCPSFFRVAETAWET